MTKSQPAHPITVEVVRNAIVAYADEMGRSLSRAAYNMMIYEVNDYCCGLIDTQGRMISQNRGGVPIFLADLGVAVLDGIDRYGLDGFVPGDVIVMNQAEVCGQHLNNVVVYAPCFFEGKIVAFAASRAHWTDIGGVRQGFASNTSTDIYAEGLQMRSLKIYEAGKRNETLWQIIRDNVRFADAALGDLRAQIASCNLGARRYNELLTRYGQDTVESCIGVIWDQAELVAREAVAAIPDGTYEAESFLDNDGRNMGVPIRIKVTVIVSGSRMTIDFTGTNPQTQSALNSGRSGGIAAARIAFKNLTLPKVEVNEGCFKPLEVILPDGTFLSAKPPAAIGQWSIALPTVIDTILKALVPAAPHLIPAAHKGDMGPCTFFGFREDGSRFLLMSVLGGGWGGRPGEDGVSASVSICQGDVRTPPVELQEIKFPFLIEEQTFRSDSGGDGEFRGGLGLKITYRALQDCKANFAFDRNLTPPWGLHGGGSGASSKGIIQRGDTSEEVFKATEVPIHAGDRITFLTAGGGGFGRPESRDRAAVSADVSAGVVSVDAARDSYQLQPE